MSKQERKNAAKAIADSAHKIWLAGLGAFSKAQAEGSKMFEQLMQEGATLEQRTRKYTKDSLGEMRGRVEAVTDRLRKSGEASMERMQSLIDERIAKAVERLSVPTREELDALVQQITDLNRSAAEAAMGPFESAAKKAPRAPATPSKRKGVKRAPAGKPARKATATPKKAAKKAPAKHRR